MKEYFAPHHIHKPFLLRSSLSCLVGKLLPLLLFAVLVELRDLIRVVTVSLGLVAVLCYGDMVGVGRMGVVEIVSRVDSKYLYWGVLEVVFYKVYRIS